MQCGVATKQHLHTLLIRPRPLRRWFPHGRPFRNLASRHGASNGVALCQMAPQLDEFLAIGHTFYTFGDHLFEVCTHHPG